MDYLIRIKIYNLQELILNYNFFFPGNTETLCVDKNFFSVRGNETLHIFMTKQFLSFVPGPVNSVIIYQVKHLFIILDNK